MNTGFKLKGNGSGLTFALALGVVTTVFAPDQAEANCVETPYLGAICVTAADFCPRGYSEAAGGLVPISSNEQLYALIGSSFGGDGRTTFGLPDMRGRIAKGVGTGPGLSPVKWGQKWGAETQTLTVKNLPGHTHQAYLELSAGPLEFTMTAYDGNGSAAQPSASAKSLQAVGLNAFQPNSEANIYGPGGGSILPLNDIHLTSYAAKATIGSTGSGEAFNIFDPTVGLTHCIAVKGLFPQRD